MIRIEPNRLLELIDCLWGSIDKDEEIAHLGENFRIIRIEFPGVSIAGVRLIKFSFVQLRPAECPVTLIVVWIKPHGGVGMVECTLESYIEVVRPLEVVITGICPGEAG